MKNWCLDFKGIFHFCDCTTHTEKVISTEKIRISFIENEIAKSPTLARATLPFVEGVQIGLRIIQRMVSRQSIRLMKCIYQCVIYV